MLTSIVINQSVYLWICLPFGHLICLEYDPVMPIRITHADVTSLHDVVPTNLPAVPTRNCTNLALTINKLGRLGNLHDVEWSARWWEPFLCWSWYQTDTGCVLGYECIACIAFYFGHAALLTLLTKLYKRLW